LRQILEGFQDALVLSKNVGIYTTDQVMMERTNDTIWRPMPYIGESINAAPGTDYQPVLTRTSPSCLFLQASASAKQYRSL
jgi:hypothetical protein